MVSGGRLRVDSHDSLGCVHTERPGHVSGPRMTWQAFLSNRTYILRAVDEL